MNKFIYIYLFFICSIVFGQQVRYIDTDVILQKMPQYQEAKTKLDEQVKSWQNDIENAKKSLDDEKKKFENEKILLTEDQIKDKKYEIDKKEVEIRESIETRFGAHGGMIKAKEKLVKPIQDLILNAITTVSQKNKIDIVIDKNSDFTVLYTNPKFDMTKEVLKELKLDDKSIEQAEKTEKRKEDKAQKEQKKIEDKKQQDTKSTERAAKIEEAKKQRLQAAEERKKARLEAQEARKKATEDAKKLKEK